MDDNPDGYVSVNEAARRMGRSIEQVRRYLREGRLSGRRIGNQWFIEAAALEAFRPARVTTARAPSEPAAPVEDQAGEPQTGKEPGAETGEARAAEAVLPEARLTAAMEAWRPARDNEEPAPGEPAVSVEIQADEQPPDGAMAVAAAAEAAAAEAAAAETAAAEARKKEPLISEEFWAELDGLREEVRKQGGEFDIVAMVRQAREQG